jgi:hypothetical protein
MLKDMAGFLRTIHPYPTATITAKKKCSSKVAKPIKGTVSRDV